MITFKWEMNFEKKSIIVQESEFMRDDDRQAEDHLQLCAASCCTKTAMWVVNTCFFADNFFYSYDRYVGLNSGIVKRTYIVVSL